MTKVPLGLSSIPKVRINFDSIKDQKKNQESESN